ncbi:MAG TPA: serine hydrolase domain-containing protein [Nakamurella sp.]
MDARDPFAGLRSSVLSRAAADEFSGVVLVRRGDEVLSEVVGGRASRSWSVPMTAAMRFDVASITKLFTSVAALRLVGDCRLALDTRIVDVLDLADTTISPQVTVRHLLTHTSGIADDADEEAGEDYADLFVDVPSYGVVEIADTLPFFVHKPPVFAPGQGCRYCNAGYQLAGLAVERISGLRFREFVRENVFEPAGMTRSGFFWRQDDVPDVAEGWDPVSAADPGRGGWRQNTYSYPPIGDAAGGAHVTAADLIGFLQALRAGRLLNAELTAAFLTPQAKHHERDGHEIWYGFGLEFDLDADGAVRSYYKDGINAGASAIVRHYPGPDIDVAVLSNSEKGAWPVIDDVHRSVRALHPDVGESGF